MVDDESAGVCVSPRTQSVNDETIAQHFDLPWPVTIRAVAPNLNTDTNQWAAFGAEKESALAAICWEVVKELAQQPYAGPATHALVMDIAMKRFHVGHGNVPSSWIKVMNDYRRATQQP